MKSDWKRKIFWDKTSKKTDYSIDLDNFEKRARFACHSKKLPKKYSIKKDTFFHVKIRHANQIFSKINVNIWDCIYFIVYLFKKLNKKRNLSKTIKILVWNISEI